MISSLTPEPVLHDYCRFASQVIHGSKSVVGCNDNERLANCILRIAPRGECNFADVALRQMEEFDRRLLANTMKRTIKIMALAVAMAAFAVPALAQSKECNDENKAAWYKTFYDNFKGDANQQKTAYDAANTYIAACPADPADQQRPYMEKWAKKYKDVIEKAALVK